MRQVKIYYISSHDLHSFLLNINGRYVIYSIGHRLTGSLLASLNAVSAVDCISHCLNNNCCRAVNYKKKGPNENCELLHIMASDDREFVKKDDNYDYFVLLEPNRVGMDCRPILHAIESDN